jgi:hypothetical protein
LVAILIGYVLGTRLLSPAWQDVIRYTGLGLVVVVILANPLTGLLLWIVLEPFTHFWYLNIRMPIGIPDLSLARFSVALLMTVLAAQLAVGRRRMRRFGLAEFFMMAFCIMVMPATVAGLNGLNRSIQIILDKFLTPYLAFVLAKNLYERRGGFDRFIGAMSLIGGYLCLLVFHEQLTGRPLFYLLGRTTSYTASLRKIVSLLGNPLFLGTVLGMIVPLMLFKMVRSPPGFGRVLYGGLFLTTTAGCFLCYNRGAWLALGSGLFTMLILRREYRRILGPILLLAVLGALVYWEGIAGSAVVTERLTNTSSLRFRMTMLDASMKILGDHLLFGVGVDSFSHYFLEYGGHWETLAFDLPMPHNTYILVMVTMGLLAFVPYLMVFLSVIGEMLGGIRRAMTDEEIDGALVVAGLASVVVYMVSAVSADLYVSAFSSLVVFTISGGVVGYLSAPRGVGRTPLGRV